VAKTWTSIMFISKRSCSLERVMIIPLRLRQTAWSDIVYSNGE
jgi:hypothetical protein